jgi:hypothetical protein
MIADNPVADGEESGEGVRADRELTHILTAPHAAC